MQIPNWSCDRGIWLPLEANGLLIPRAEDFFEIQSRVGDVLVFPSSGTGGSQPKWVVLSWNKWVLQSRQIIKELGLEPYKKWGSVLPTFHVGGFGLYLRAYLNQSSLLAFEEKWNSQRAYKFLQEYQIEVVSLVPTQLFDLVQLSLLAPETLKLVFIGGASISEGLVARAIELGWPVQVTFGMTETGAFFAYQKRGMTGFTPLSEYEVLVDTNSRLCIRSPFLFEGYYENGTFFPVELNSDGYWVSPDLAQLEGRSSFFILGRSQSDYIKVKGEGVSLSVLKKKLSYFISVSISEELWELVACPCERQGSRLILVLGTPLNESLERRLARWNLNCLPFERVQLVTLPQNEWPRTAVGKIHLSELTQKACQLDPIKNMGSN